MQLNVRPCVYILGQGCKYISQLCACSASVLSGACVSESALALVCCTLDSSSKLPPTASHSEQVRWLHLTLNIISLKLARELPRGMVSTFLLSRVTRHFPGLLLVVLFAPLQGMLSQCVHYINQYHRAGHFRWK